MTTAKALAERVRADDSVKAVDDHHRRGVEAFLQAYAYVEDGNPGQSPAELCEMAESYLVMTATPALTEMEWRAAEATRDALIRLAG